MVSTRNPFRNTTPSVPRTSTSPSPDLSTSTALVSSNNNSTSREDHPSSSLTHPERTDGEPESSVIGILTQDLPPAYTPSPNVYEGETTLEVGPRRAFQQPPPVASQNRSHYQFPPQSWLPSSTSAWASFPGQPHREQHRGYNTPPAHPDLVRMGPRPISTPNSPISEFARDFYEAGARDPEPYGGSSAWYQREPSGPPSSTPPTSHEESPLGASSSHASPAHNHVADDGRPTSRPVPGHPLLRYGNCLVYPPGYECHKCRNTGYKNFDPSHPCARCWAKYATPFSGALAYAPWPTSADAAASSTYQRALPVFRAPQAALHHQHSQSWSGGGPIGTTLGLARAATTSRVGGGGGSGLFARLGAIPILDGILPLSGGQPGFPSPSAPPPGVLSEGPNANGRVVVFAPGDARLGGRMCWRCGGKGTTSLLIFEEVRCSICGGLGRTFV